MEPIFKAKPDLDPFVLYGDEDGSQEVDLESLREKLEILNSLDSNFLDGVIKKREKKKKKNMKKSENDERILKHVNQYKTLFKQLLCGISLLSEKNRTELNKDSKVYEKRSKEFQSRLKRMNFEFKHKICKRATTSKTITCNVLRYGLSVLTAYHRHLPLCGGRVNPEGLVDSLNNFETLFKSIPAAQDLLEDVSRLRHAILQPKIKERKDREITERLIADLAKLKFDDPVKRISRRVNKVDDNFEALSSPIKEDSKPTYVVPPTPRPVTSLSDRALEEILRYRRVNPRRDEEFELIGQLVDFVMDYALLDIAREAVPPEFVFKILHKELV